MIGKCIICGSKQPELVGMFKWEGKEFQKHIGAPDGKISLIPYSICEACLGKTEEEKTKIASIVEDIILSKTGFYKKH